MTQEQTLKFGVIGAGKIGTFHTRTLAKMKGVTLVGVCDPDVIVPKNWLGSITVLPILNPKNWWAKWMR